jgi:hypothetical protein
LADNLAVPMEKPLIPGREDVSCRGCGAEHVAQAVDGTAFEIDAGKQARANAVLAVAQKLPGLLGSLDVACEQNDAAGLNSGDQGREARRDFGAVEAEDEKLAELIPGAYDAGPSATDRATRRTTERNQLTMTKITISMATRLAVTAATATVCRTPTVA